MFSLLNVFFHADADVALDGRLHVGQQHPGRQRHHPRLVKGGIPQSNNVDSVHVLPKSCLNRARCLNFLPQIELLFPEGIDDPDQESLGDVDDDAVPAVPGPAWAHPGMPLLYCSLFY